MTFSRFAVTTLVVLLVHVIGCGSDDAGMSPHDGQATGPGLDTILLGEVVLDATGTTAPISLTLPADVVSVLLVFSGDDQSYFRVKSFTGPNGENLASTGEQGPNTSTVNVVTGVGSFLVPNNPEVVLTGGEWTAQIEGSSDPINFSIPAEGHVNVRALIKRGKTTDKASLDLALHFTPGSGFTASDAATDSKMTAIVERVSKAFESVNIEIGEITYSDISDPSFDNLDEAYYLPDSDYRQLVSTGTAKTALNVYFVATFGGDSPTLTSFTPSWFTRYERTLRGVSSAIGGPAMFDEIAGGVVLAALEAPEALPLTVTHEIGHYLGLYHLDDDHLADTPQQSEPAAGQNFMTDSDIGSDVRFSADQGKVFRMHPLINWESAN